VKRASLFVLIAIVLLSLAAVGWLLGVLRGRPADAPSPHGRRREPRRAAPAR